MPPSLQPVFIVLDGPDGSGTTFHAEKLSERLRKERRDVLLAAEPTSGVIGGLLRSLLHGGSLPSPDAMQLLFCADRANHLASEILPALREGKTIVCDRYVPSTIAYGRALGLDAAWLHDVNKIFIQPDVLIFTLPPFEVCLERIQRREHQDAYERRDFQKKVYAAYVTMAEENPAIITVDTSGEKEAVADELFVALQKRQKPPMCNRATH